MIGPRNILITGGSSGIGLALAARLAKKHRILVTARSISPALQSLIDTQPDISFLALDQSDPSSMADQLESGLAAREWKRLDYAVLNAGTGFVTAPGDEHIEALQNTLAVNLTANIALAHALYPVLKNTRGKLVFVGSTARKGAANFSSYAASKAALHGFARALKEEWRGKVTVQIVHPGPTKTDMHEKAGLKLGWSRMFFADPNTVAHLVENAMAGSRFSVNVNLIQYWGGNQFLSRGIR